jgi:hypothetical protein
MRAKTFWNKELRELAVLYRRGATTVVVDDIDIKTKFVERPALVVHRRKTGPQENRFPFHFVEGQKNDNKLVAILL